jgi:hypothetical protein
VGCGRSARLVLTRAKQLKAFSEIPRTTRTRHRGTLRVPADPSGILRQKKKGERHSDKQEKLHLVI